MKILHALVGYLAITALPFHSFAFASPLAGIDYDGYLNITQNHIDSALMKHALGTIVETCQTVTTSTQNHKDTALMKRRGGPGDIIEARQGELAVPLAFIVTVIVAGIFLKLIWFNDDDKVRGNDVELIVERSDQKCSARNVWRLLKVPSAEPFRSIQNLTGLFATPPIPSNLMELRAGTMVTLITN